MSLRGIYVNSGIAFRNSVPRLLRQEISNGEADHPGGISAGRYVGSKCFVRILAARQKSRESVESLSLRLRTGMRREMVKIEKR